MNSMSSSGADAVTVSFQPDQKQICAPAGTTLLAAAAQAGISLQASCGGRGACGKCVVKFVSAPPSPTPAELRRFSPQELTDGYRLACQVQMATDMTVEIPPASRMIREQISLEGIGRQVEVSPNIRKIFLKLTPPTLADQRADLIRLLEALGDHAAPPADLSLLQDLPGRLRQENFQVTAVLADGSLLDVEAGDTTAHLYGMAFDIGTTTMVGYLLDLASGVEVAVASTINPQTQFGDDVVSRIAFAGQGDGLARLQQTLLEALNHLIGEACRESGVEPHQLYELTLVGNTCMTHLLLGINPASLATLPYVPVNTAPVVMAAATLGLDVNPRARVTVLPNIAGFVGADTVGVIIASGLEESDGRVRLAVDIGTNGEMVVAHAGRMIACSTAAGPAFEGARISQGMRAASGAIDQVNLIIGPEGPQLELHTVDNTPPRGICGSGLVDAVAALLQVGLITPAGRLLDADSAPAQAGKLIERLAGAGGQTRFLLASAEASAGAPVYLTAKDVRELQLAKAAICAGLLFLLEKIGIALNEVDELLLAGAFGNYIRRESAQAIGLLPNLPLEKIKPVGNAAGLGAKLALASVELRRLAEQAAQRVEYVELSEETKFYQWFTDAMQLAPAEDRIDS